jgi:hypothetical protein
MGSTGGSETHTITTAELPATIPVNAVPGNFVIATGGGGTNYNVSANATQAWSVGGGVAVNTYTPSLVMMMIIKAF